MSANMSRTARATSASCVIGTSGPGSRSNTKRVAGPGFWSMKRHCGTCTSSAACCAIHAMAAGRSMIGWVGGPGRLRVGRRVHPSRCRLGDLLLEERGLFHPVRPSFARGGPARNVGKHVLGDARVVPEHLFFGRARDRVEHLVGVRQADVGAGLVLRGPYLGCAGHGAWVPLRWLGLEILSSRKRLIAVLPRYTAVACPPPARSLRAGGPYWRYALHLEGLTFFWAGERPGQGLQRHRRP